MPTADPRRRLAFLITQFDTGGAQAQLLVRLRALDRTRFDPVVLVLTRRAGFLLDAVRDLGVRVECVGLDEEQTLFGKLARLRAVLRAERPDVATAILCWDHTIGAISACLADVPSVVVELQNEREAVRRAFSRGFRIAEAACINACADLVVACSDHVARSYVQAWPWITSRTVVVHNAVDVPTMPRRLPAVDGATLTVGTIGRLMPQKHHALLLEAAAMVVAQVPATRFVFVGTGPLEADLVQRRCALGLEPYVTFTGEARDPLSMLASFDVFALSSRWEGLPLVILEAMATGLPVVATDVGGVREAVLDGRTGLVTPPDDAGALARALVQVLSDPALRKRMGDAGRAHVLQHFTAAQHARRWEAVYDALPTRPRVTQPASADDARRSGRPAEGRPPRARDVRRLLLLRLCPEARFAALATLVSSLYPGAALEVLAQEAWSPAAGSTFAAVHRYGSGPFSLGGARGVVRALRRRRYDLVVLPYNVVSGAGYRHAEAAALLIGRGRFLAASAWNTDVRVMGIRAWRHVVGLSIARALAVVPAAALVSRGLLQGLWRRVAPSRTPRQGQWPASA